MLNLFQINNEDIIDAIDVVYMSLLLTLNRFFSVCIVGFKQVNADWVSNDQSTDFLKDSCSKSKGKFSLELLR